MEVVNFYSVLHFSLQNSQDQGRYIWVFGTKYVILKRKVNQIWNKTFDILTVTVLISAMNYIDQLTKELMVQEHVLRELQQEQERRRQLQQEHSQWSNKIHNLRWVRVRENWDELELERIEMS